jgi:phage tail-like protein
MERRSSREKTMKKLGVLLVAVAAAAGVAVLVGNIEWNLPPARAQGAVGNFNFKVEIDGVASANFSAVDGLSVEVEVIEFSSAEDPVIRKRPGRVKYGDITLKKGYVSNSELFDWIQGAATGELERKRMSIVLTDARGAEVQRWNCFECFPKSWRGPSLVGGGAALGIEKIEIAVEKVERAK